MAEESKNELENFEITWEKSDTKLVIRSDNYEYDTSFMNALRRSTMNNCICYALSPTIIDQINDQMKFKIHDPETQRLIAKKIFESGKNGIFSRAPIIPAVLQSTCGNTQVLSHRLSRVPIKNLLELDKYLYFIVIGTINPDLQVTPYININNSLLTVYSDLNQEYIHLFVYKDDKIFKVTGMEGSGKNFIHHKDLFEELFPVHIPILCLKKNESVLAISFINKNYEKMDSRYIPCITRYRFIPHLNDREVLTDQELLELMSYQNQKERLEKKEGDLEFDYKFDSLYEQPKRIELTIEYNHKISPDTCLVQGISYLVKQLHTFLHEYLNQESSLIKKEFRTTYLQILSCSNGKTEFDFNLADHTLGNLITSHLVYRVFNRIMTFLPDEIAELAQNTQIAYRKPHPLIDEIEIQYQLPFNLYNENKELYQKFFGTDQINDHFMDDYRNSIMSDVINRLIQRLEQIQKSV